MRALAGASPGSSIQTPTIIHHAAPSSMAAQHLFARSIRRGANVVTSAARRPASISDSWPNPAPDLLRGVACRPISGRWCARRPQASWPAGATSDALWHEPRSPRPRCGMRSRLREKGRKNSGTFANVPGHVLQSPEYSKLSAGAAKLMLDLMGQFNGYNNGKLTATWVYMRQRGWSSQHTLKRKRDELLHARFAVITRYGHQHQSHCYAVTFHNVDWADAMSGVMVQQAPTHEWRDSSTTRTAPLTPLSTTRTAAQKKGSGFSTTRTASIRPLPTVSALPGVHSSKTSPGETATTRQRKCAA